MTRYDTFILYAFVVLLLIRLILVQMGLRSRASRIQPWAVLDGQRIPRGKGVTLLVANRWVIGAVHGHHISGLVIIRSEAEGFMEIDPADIQIVRVYDL